MLCCCGDVGSNEGGMFSKSESLSSDPLDAKRRNAVHTVGMKSTLVSRLMLDRANTPTHRVDC